MLSRSLSTLFTLPGFAGNKGEWRKALCTEERKGRDWAQRGSPATARKANSAPSPNMPSDGVT